MAIAKQLVKAGLGRLGYGIMRVPQPSLLSQALARFIRENEINLILDVGAFRGQYCRMLRDEVRYDGLIASFEPCAGSFQSLRASMAADRRWRGFNFGLSESDTTASLNTYGDRGDFNSVLPLRDEPAAIYAVDTRTVATETIHLHKLESVWDQITAGLAAPRVLLKIDTQGHDTAVVKGALGSLPFIHGIQSELPVVEIYEGMTSMPDALKLYRELGYVPVGFFPVNTPQEYGVSPEFDVLFRRFEPQTTARQ